MFLQCNHPLYYTALTMQINAGIDDYNEFLYIKRIHFCIEQKYIDNFYTFRYTVYIIILKGELQSGRSYTIVDLTQCFR